MQPDNARPILDADLVSVDAELRAAGRQAERMLRSRTQPTRWFSIGLRDRLLGRLRATRR